MSGLYEFEYSSDSSVVKVELVGGPGDGLIAPASHTVVITPPLDGDPSDVVGHGYQFREDPPRYQYFGLVYEDDINDEEADDE